MKILLSKNKALLLRLFFTHPGRAYYIQEIGRILKKKPGVFQRDLNNLAKEGILESFYKVNARYFKINKEYPLYKQLKEIISKTIGIEGSLKEALSKIEGIESAFIFGSYAKGEERAISDIDLFIIGHPDENKVIESISKLEKKLDREINYHIYSEKDLEKKIKEKDSFIKRVLKGPKIMLIGKEDELSRFN